MIRLKDILSEQNPDPFGLRDLFNINKSSGAFKKLAKDLERKRNKRKSDSDSDKADSSLNVLFIGDEETDVQYSYANKLLLSGRVTGDIVADDHVSTKKLRKLTDKYTSDQYDVISIMDSGNDPTKITSKQSILNLIDIFKKAKKYGAILIVISSSKKDKEVHQWIVNQSLSDYVIDIDRFATERSFLKSDFLNQQTHERIANRWLRIVASSIGRGQISQEKDISVKTMINLGDSGETVYKIQQRLVELDYNIGDRGLTGEFDKYTESAVKDFQANNELPVTGVVDDDTTFILFSDAALSANQKYDDIEVTTSGKPESFSHYAKIIIDKFEGGYFNPGMPEGSDPVYARSGETMMGIDRLRSSYETDTDEGREFWEIIDANSGWAEESDGEEKWTYNYRGGDLEAQLTDLVSRIMEPQHNKNFDAYLSTKAKQIVNNDYNLTFHFIRATWNGSGWFQYFARKIDEAIVNGITNPEELMSVAMDSRINTTYTKDANAKKLIRRSGEKLQKELKPYK